MIRISGINPKNTAQSREAKDLLLLVSFSGGGSRAAAFSCGVLEALRDTRVPKRGRDLRLLDEVDLISGVSGGSFIAAYYGLFGDRIFQDFEQKFLYGGPGLSRLFGGAYSADANHPIEVKFDALKDPAERTYFKRLPTSFSLPAEEVDKLRQAAGR